MIQQAWKLGQAAGKIWYIQVAIPLELLYETGPHNQ
jgi:hypothetical protein